MSAESTLSHTQGKDLRIILAHGWASCELSQESDVTAPARPIPCRGQRGTGAGGATEVAGSIEPGGAWGRNVRGMVICQSLWDSELSHWFPVHSRFFWVLGIP